MSLEYTTVPSGQVHAVLDKVLPFLPKMSELTSGRSTVDDILGSILNGTYTLWLAFDTDTKDVLAVAVTQIINYPRLRALNVQHVKGDWQMDKLLDGFMKLFKQYAQDAGCSKIELSGRRGWLKALEPYGVKPQYYIAEINIGV